MALEFSICCCFSNNQSQSLVWVNHCPVPWASTFRLWKMVTHLSIFFFSHVPSNKFQKVKFLKGSVALPHSLYPPLFLLRCLLSLFSLQRLCLPRSPDGFELSAAVRMCTCLPPVEWVPRGRITLPLFAFIGQDLL